MKFNEKLVQLRKKHGYTQEQLAEKLGVTRQAVSINLAFSTCLSIFQFVRYFKSK